MKKARAISNKLFIIIILIVIVSLVGMVTYSVTAEQDNPMKGYKVAYVDHDLPSAYIRPTNQLFNTYSQYQEFQSKFNLSDVLNQDMFRDNEYFAYVYANGSCTQTVTYPISAGITNDKIKLVMFNDNAKGVCAVSEEIYYIPIEKNKISSILPVEVEFRWK